MGDGSGRDEWMKRTGPLFPLLVAYKLQTGLPIARGLELEDDDVRRACAWLPVVGLLAGLLLLLVAKLLLTGIFVPALSGALLMVLVFVIGGGWTDRSLLRVGSSAARDWQRGSRPWAVGAAPVASGSLLALSLGRILLLESTAVDSWPSVLLATMICGRLAQVVAVFASPMLQSTSDQVTQLSTAPFANIAAAAVLSVVVGLLFTGYSGLLIIPTLVVTAVIGRWLAVRFAGVDDSVLGAIGAVAELLMLVGMAALNPATISPFQLR